MGRQMTVAYRNLLGFWVFGIPCGALLTFVGGVGLSGLWWGLTVGLTLTSVISVVELRQGPVPYTTSPFFSFA
jgi:MATE family multidrug resistance protein